MTLLFKLWWGVQRWMCLCTRYVSKLFPLFVPQWENLNFGHTVDTGAFKSSTNISLKQHPTSFKGDLISQGVLSFLDELSSCVRTSYMASEAVVKEKKPLFIQITLRLPVMGSYTEYLDSSPHYCSYKKLKETHPHLQRSRQNLQKQLQKRGIQTAVSVVWLHLIPLLT